MDEIEARQLLAVEVTASPFQLRSAYRRMLKRWHPDRFAPASASYPEAVIQTQRINAAYQVLVGGAGRQAVQPHVADPSSAVDWSGTPISTVDWRWWPIRALASDRTTIPVGALVFILLWAVLVGLGLAIEAVLK